MSHASSTAPGARRVDIQTRTAVAGDLSAIRNVFSSTSVLNGTMRLPFDDVDGLPKRLEPKPGTFQIVGVAGDAVVGFAELITYPAVPRYRHVAKVNLIAVDADWQGQGIGRTMLEALIDLAENWLQIHRLELLVWDTNERAQSLYRSCGFALEGTFRDFVFTNGEFHDAHQMARIT